jgi:hypothetical protein
LAFSISALAAEPGKTAEPPGAVRVRVTIAQEAGDKRPVAPPRSYQLVATDNGATARLTIGARVAIPAPSVGSKSDVAPVASFTYQNVGATIQCHVVRAGLNAYHVHVALEDSWMDPAAAALGSQATIETTSFSLDLNTVVASGRPQVLGRVAQPEESQRLVELLIEPM